MSQRTRPLRAFGIVTVAATLAVAVLAATPAGGTESSGDLFSSGPESRTAVPRMLRTRTATLATPLATATGPLDVTINLFDDTSVAVTLERQPGKHPVVWTGDIPGMLGTSVLITVSGEYVYGTIHLGEHGTYTLRSLGDSTFMIGEVDPASFGQESEPVDVEDPPAVAGTPEEAATPRVKPTIDVMILWTVEVLDTEFGGDDAAGRAWAATRIAELNTVFSDSEVNAKARLAFAGTAEYDDGEDSDPSILGDLYNFTFLAGEDCNGEGVCDPEAYLDDEHAQRELVGADIAFLVVEDDNEYGIAWSICRPDTGAAVPNVGTYCSEARAFGVGEFTVADAHYTIPHEIGHILGGKHDAANGGTDYARGYKKLPKFSTVVAYECAPGGVDCALRAGVYSNPDVLWTGDGSTPMGEPIGDQSKPHGDDGADNASHFNLSTDLVSDFFTLETCHGKTPTILGTDKADDIGGTGGNDVIMSFGGGDLIDAKGGKDFVCAGDGVDDVSGAGGKDRIYGENGNDILSGGNQNDRLYGGNGDDTLKGGKGSEDRLYGNKGLDDLDGGKGSNDYCTSGEVYSHCEN